MKSIAFLLSTILGLGAASNALANELAADELKAIKNIAPKYPRTAMQKGLEGCVLLGFTVTETGLTDNFQVLDSQPAGAFDEAALNALYATKFKQPIKAGRHARTYTFTLDKSKRQAKDIKAMCKPVPSYAELNPPAKQ